MPTIISSEIIWAIPVYLSGDLKGAEKIFQDILAENPDYTLASNNLGRSGAGREKKKRP